MPDLVQPNELVPFDEEAVVLRVEHGPRRIASSKRRGGFLRDPEADEGRARYGWAGWGEDPSRILWPVILSGADLLTSEEAPRIDMCPGEDCGWMFLDRSTETLATTDDLVGVVHMQVNADRGRFGVARPSQSEFRVLIGQHEGGAGDAMTPRSRWLTGVERAMTLLPVGHMAGD